MEKYYANDEQSCFHSPEYEREKMKRNPTHIDQHQWQIAEWWLVAMVSQRRQVLKYVSSFAHTPSARYVFYGYILSERSMYTAKIVNIETRCEQKMLL